MKLLIVLSAVALVAVIAAPHDSSSAPGGRHHGKHGTHGTHAPPTEEQKAKFEKDRKEALAKLSPEAQKVAQEIHEAIKAKKEGESVHDVVKSKLVGVPESVKDELKTLEKFHHGKHHGHGHKGHGGRRTTVKA